MQQELDDFLTFCRIERRLAPLTCSAYERDVRALLRFLESRQIRDLVEVRPRDLRAFLADEATHRPAVSSQARTVAALKGFFRFLVENEVLERDPASVLRTPKKSEALPDVLDKRELARLLRSVEREDVWQRVHPGKRERDRLLLALFAYAGVRRSELLGLDVEDLDLAQRLVRVRKAKGGRARVVPVHPALVPLAVEYLNTRGLPVAGPLFVGVQGRRLSATMLSVTFRRYTAAAGVDGRKRVTPHTLRHVFASELLRAGANLRQILGAARPQAPRLNPAIHARHGPRATRRGEAAPTWLVHGRVGELTASPVNQRLHITCGDVLVQVGATVRATPHDS